MALRDFRRQHGQMTGAFKPMTSVPIKPTQPAKPIQPPKTQQAKGIVAGAMGPMVAK